MNIYQIKVTLKHCRPPIWRRVLVPADIKLPRLHRVLQMVMGWLDCHLHAFNVHGEQYGIPDSNFPGMFKSERNVRLDKLVAVGGKIVYEYDFGDDWEHELKIEKAYPAQAGMRYPLCINGKRACPPEDCGGPWGYEHLLEVLRDPAHEEHGEMLEWIGEDFDPEAFDVEDINAGLRTVK